MTREAFGTRERTLVTTKEKNTFVFYMYLSVDRIHCILHVFEFERIVPTFVFSTFVFFMYLTF